MSASEYLEDVMLDLVLGTSTVAATVYLALFENDPGEFATGTEISGSGYARAEIDNNSSNFPDAISGIKENGAQITFPEATGAWGDATHWGLFDAPTGGNMLFYGEITDGPVSVVSGDVPFVGVSSMVISLD